MRLTVSTTEGPEDNPLQKVRRDDRLQKVRRDHPLGRSGGMILSRRWRENIHSWKNRRA